MVAIRTADRRIDLPVETGLRSLRARAVLRGTVVGDGEVLVEWRAAGDDVPGGDGLRVGLVVAAVPVTPLDRRRTLERSTHAILRELVLGRPLEERLDEAVSATWTREIDHESVTLEGGGGPDGVRRTVIHFSAKTGLPRSVEETFAGGEVVRTTPWFETSAGRRRPAGWDQALLRDGHEQAPLRVRVERLRVGDVDVPWRVTQEMPGVGSGEIVLHDLVVNGKAVTTPRDRGESPPPPGPGILATLRAEGESQRLRRVQLDLARIGLAVMAWRVDHEGALPPDLEALGAPPSEGARPYLPAGLLADPWGRPYEFLPDDTGPSFRIRTLGRDGTEGGDGEDADVERTFR